MPKNLEIKIKLANRVKFLNRITKLKAQKIYSSEQVDVYFQNEKGRLKVRDSNGEKSVIFYSRVEDGRERWSKFHFIKVESPKEWVSFFKLFMKPLVTVKKHRTLFHYKNTRIHLDKIKGLGNFIELETKVNSSLKKAREEVEFLCKDLGLSKNDQILNSYSDLLIAKKVKSKK
ncbi:MAG: class IV adenylate cyclase [Ignavibacteria bacterium]|nr:class IV adenylate cyclase [Ignavibacteria bacterium]